jgi:hypothetical protein
MIWHFRSTEVFQQFFNGPHHLLVGADHVERPHSPGRAMSI